MIADYAAQCTAGPELVAGLDLDHGVAFRGGEVLSVGWVDVVRELLDGVTGE